MNFKSFIRLFTPPIAILLLKRLRPVVGITPEWEYLPDGWREAKGWNAEGVLETYKSKWNAFQQAVSGTAPLGIAHEAFSISNENYSVHNTVMTYAYILSLTCQGCDRLSVLDWGGGLGQYYLLSKALLPQVHFDYYCMEVPLIVEYGQKHIPEIKFIGEDNTYMQQSYDLVFASSSLHYSQNWREVLKNLAAVTGKYLYITRTPFVKNSPSFVVLQRAYQYNYDTEYCGWFLNRDEFLGYASELGLKLQREFLVDEEPLVGNAPERGKYRGFLFQK